MKAKVLTIVLCGVILLAGSATQGQREPKGEPGMFPGLMMPGLQAPMPQKPRPGGGMMGGMGGGMMGGMGGGAAMRGLVEIQSLLAINSSSAVFELDDNLVETLVNSPFVFGADVRQDVERIDVEIGANIWKDVKRIDVDIVSRKDNQSLFRLRINCQDGSDFAQNAEQYLAEIGKRLERALAKEYGRRVDQLNQARGFAEEQREIAERELTDLQSLARSLREEAEQSDLSREFILDKTRDLEREREKMRMRLASQEARRGAIQDQIAKIGAESQKRLSADPIADELEEIVKISERRIRFVEAEAESPRLRVIETDNAREKLAKARIELMTRREAVKSSVGGEQMARWNDNLAITAVEAAEMESNLGFVERQLHDIKEKGLLELADRYEVEVAVKMPVVKGRFIRATERAEELKRQMETICPLHVVLLGAEAEGEPKEESSEPDGG